jgi:hypothetical protein
VIVEVANPYQNVEPGVRPPLLPDVFCEVTLFGATVNNVAVIPRDTLREDRVYLLRDGRLHVAQVKTLVLEENLAVVEDGIENGDLVVMTDLFPASEGMPLRAKLTENPVSARSSAKPDAGELDGGSRQLAEGAP